MITVNAQTDEVLFAEYLSGSESSFTDLYNRHVQKIWAMVMSFVRNPDVADDVVQDTFLRLHSCRTMRKGDKVKPWLRRIAYNRAVDSVRTMSRNRASKAQTLPDADILGGESDTVFQNVWDTERRQRVRDLLATLPHKHQHTLALCYLEGMSRQQMAEVWKVPLGTLKDWLRDAHVAFAQVWKEHDHVSM